MISRRALLGAGLVVLPLAACGGAAQEQPAASLGNGDDFNGSRLPSGPDLPDVTLTDTSGSPFNLATDFTTPVVALFFGYTNCPDVCPGIMADMATARRRLEDDLAQQVSLAVVTTDPARDTPEALGEYLQRVDEDFIGLTGDIEDILAAAAPLGIAIEEGRELPSGGYEVDHSTQILGFNQDRRMEALWTQPSIGDLRDDLATLLADAR